MRAANIVALVLALSGCSGQPERADKVQERVAYNPKMEAAITLIEKVMPARITEPTERAAFREALRDAENTSYETEERKSAVRLLQQLGRKYEPSDPTERAMVNEAYRDVAELVHQ